MDGRKERCSWCGAQLVAPPDANTVHCPVCQTDTRTRQNDTFCQEKSCIRHTKNRIKSFINRVSNNIHRMATPMGNYTVPGPHGHYHDPQRIKPPSFLPPVSAHGRKRALLCGVSYYGRSYKLKGSVNDVMCMKYFLIEKLGFPKESILVLTEEETNPFQIPAKRNIRAALQWLVQGCQPGDSLVFHYSGHGSQQPNFNGDEIDGYDETICPLDFETEGMILDDEINATIVRPLPRGAKLHAIIDACHSGTVLDLPFVCRIKQEGYYAWEDQRRLSAPYKGTSRGLAISLSACDDPRMAVDTTALSGNAVTGAMTYSFIQAVQTEPGLTYGQLLGSMHRILCEAKAGSLLNGPFASHFGKMLNTDLSQEAQLSSSEKFEIYSTPFML